MSTSQAGETFRFHNCTLNVAAYELRRDGRPVRLERRPMDLLILLVQRRQQLVSRSEITALLWGEDDKRLNTRFLGVGDWELTRAFSSHC